MRFLFFAAIVAITGCAQTRSMSQYNYGATEKYFTSDKLQAITGEQIERGERRPVLDSVGWVLGIPSKIVLWDRRVDNHSISPETEAAIAEYLAVNDLTSVKVRLNQYAPGDEWRRLRANTAVGPGWRYTLGVVDWLGDAVFAGRLFGGDHYSPYTNTIHIYSDVPVIGLHEAGHAKDWARRKYKGTYAAVYLLPGAPLWHEAIASRDALAYVDANGTRQEQQEAYRLLYPAYGTYVGSAVSDFLPGLGIIPYAGAVVAGHVVGRVQGSMLPDDSPTNQSHTDEPQPAPSETQPGSVTGRMLRSDP